MADAVGRAAVDDSPPPVIMLTSTNNQAVRTAAAELTVDSGEMRRYCAGVGCPTCCHSWPSMTPVGRRRRVQAG